MAPSLTYNKAEPAPMPATAEIQQKEMSIHEDGSRIPLLKKELEISMSRISSLEKENHELRQEMARLKAQVNMLKAHDIERKSMLWKKLQNSIDCKILEPPQQKPSFQVDVPEQSPLSLKKPNPKESITEAATNKETPANVPIPPPKPTQIQSAPPPQRQQVTAPPPPPPPLPLKLIGSKAVRRVPAVMEFYRSLMKRDTQREKKNSSVGIPPVLNSRDMIGEIENRSTYLSAIKSDVETHGQLVNFLTREIQSAAFTDISDVETFVKWLDGELSCLVDERAVLKHFPQWPERKADALREAAFSYRDLKNLESEVSTFKNNPKQTLTQSLRRIQALQDRVEQSVSSVERVREGTSRKYRELQIPWQWLMDIGVIGQIKLSSLTLAKEYMKRITRDLQSKEPAQDEDLLLQGVRFSFRVHQFAGGFDEDTMHAFEELKEIGTGLYK